jgi:hypothetical protein
MKSSVFWNVMLYCPVKVKLCFGGSYRDQQDKQETSMKQAAHPRR